jgi:nucleoid DNA-binding protein
MNKKEIAKAIQPFTKDLGGVEIRRGDILDFLRALADFVHREAYHGRTVVIPDIVKIIPHTTKPRKRHSLSSGEVVEEPAKKTVKFVAIKHLKEAVNGELNFEDDTLDGFGSLDLAED